MSLSPKLVALFSAILGISATSCNSFDAPAMYGCPHADYDIKGTVTDDEGSPLEGISIEATNTKGYHVTIPELCTTKTDKDGSYKLKFNTSVLERIDIHFVDEAGEYADETKTFSVKFTDGDGSWFIGTAFVTADAKLKKLEKLDKE